MSKSIANKVERSIYARPRGSIFFRNNFSKIGSTEAIRQSLSRLEKKGVLLRLANGIYLYPKKHKTLGILYPSLDEIANAIAKRDKARIIPTGVLALNKLGISNQVPLNAVYLIDGSSRSVKIGRSSIKFKKASPKTLSVKNEMNLLIIQALKELGEQNIDNEILKKIKAILSKISTEEINKDMMLAPVWIANIVFDVLKTNNGQLV